MHMAGSRRRRPRIRTKDSSQRSDMCCFAALLNGSLLYTPTTTHKHPHTHTHIELEQQVNNQLLLLLMDSLSFHQCVFFLYFLLVFLSPSSPSREPERRSASSEPR